MKNHAHKVARFGLLAALSLVLGFFDRAIPLTALLSGAEVSRQEHEEMSRLMQMLMEPSVMPMYRVLAPDFYDRYLMKG